MSEFIIVFLASKLHIIIAGLAIVYFLFTNTHNKLKLIVLGTVTLPASYIVGKIIGVWVETTRPFVVLGVNPLVPHIADNGFPSEHTLYAIIIAGVVWSVHRKLGIFLAILAILVGVGRVFALVHNPIDIVGSILIAGSIITIVSISPIATLVSVLTHMIEKCWLQNAKKNV